MKNTDCTNTNIEYFAETLESNATTLSPASANNVYGLHVIEWGECTYRIGETAYKASCDTVMLFSPKAVYEIQDGECRRKLFYFGREFLLRYFSKRYVDELLSPFALGRVKLLPEERKEILSLAAQAKRFFDEENAEKYALRLADILSAVKAAGNRREHPPTGAARLIDRITDYVKQNAFKRLELQQIADEFFISKYYLCHLFRAEKQVSLVDFITELRIERARYLLSATNKKIKEISAECGFNSEYYFSRRFHAVTGVSPREYQQRCVTSDSD